MAWGAIPRLFLWRPFFRLGFPRRLSGDVRLPPSSCPGEMRDWRRSEEFLRRRCFTWNAAGPRCFGLIPGRPVLLVLPAARFRPGRLVFHVKHSGSRRSGGGASSHGLFHVKQCFMAFDPQWLSDPSAASFPDPLWVRLRARGKGSGTGVRLGAEDPDLAGVPTEKGGSGRWRGSSRIDQSRLDQSRLDPCIGALASPKGSQEARVREDGDHVDLPSRGDSGAENPGGISWSVRTSPLAPNSISGPKRVLSEVGSFFAPFALPSGVPNVYSGSLNPPAVYVVGGTGNLPNLGSCRGSSL